ncbi:unnamed protein product, partial [Candidula unifasciata]
VGQVSVQLFRFQMIDGVDGRSGLTHARTASLVFSCAISCHQMSQPCYSFAYDEATSACTLEAPVKNDRAPVSLFQGYLFSSVVCSQPGYRLHIQRDVAMCLGVSTDKLNYTDASLACQKQGAHLLTLKTEAKLRLFGGAQKPANQLFWIGLDDIQREGIFQWLDDKTVITPDFQKQLFGEAQPDDWSPQEDCCVYDKDFYSDSYPIADAECGNKFLYFCESQPTFLSMQHST